MRNLSNQEAGQQPQQASSRASKLYRHALQSIFKFCSQKELHAILAVSRDWSSAVLSMPTIGAACGVSSLDQLSLIAHSRLARHVTEVRGECVYSLEGLRLLADRMPWIQRHRFRWRPTLGDCVEAASALSRLRHLQSLEARCFHSVDLSIESLDQHAAAVNNLITAAACLPLLEILGLHLLCHDGRILLSPLVALTRLRTFTLDAANLRSAVPSDEQVAALRQMHSLERFSHDFTDRYGTLRLVLQAPTPPLRWTEAQVTSGASDLVPLLQSLRALTALDVHCICGDVDWLLSLPQVLSLTLHGDFDRVLPVDEVARVATTLHRCPHFTALNLHLMEFTSAQLSSLLPNLPRLSRLSLSLISAIDSLRFLATEALAASLTEFRIWFCRDVPASESAHLLGLHSLRVLCLRDLREPLSDAQWAQQGEAHPNAQLRM